MAEPPVPGAISSGAFRFALLLAAVFAAGSAVLLWAVQYQIDAYAEDASRALLRSETTALASEFRSEGLGALVAAIRSRQNAPGSPFHYILLGQDGRRVIGDLPTAAAHIGWQIGPEAEPGDAAAQMRHFGIWLPGGLLLVAATDTFDIDTLRHRLAGFTIISGVAITLLALIGGIAAGQLFLVRLARINRSVEQIMAGQSAARLPAIGVGPEFAQLMGNLNRMLDRNAVAMDGLKQVSTAIAHDLRTPLTRLKQHLETMREPPGPSPAAASAAIGQIDAVLHTFAALLRIGMLEGGAGGQRFVRFDLGEVMDRLVAAYEPVAEDAGHRLTAEHVRPAHVVGDADLLAQLFANLIENAIAHTPAGTRIRSLLRLVDGAAVVTIADDGPGVAPAARAHVFDKFFRADQPRGGSGAGLGLALVAAIAERHGARFGLTRATVGFAVEIAFPAA